jgi:cystathionine beta-lyase/cystathionine gamma-synthase
VNVEFVDFADTAVIREAVRGADVVFLESPGNPMLSIVDIAEVADAAHRHRAKVVVDNTFATMVLQRPLSLGADIVVYSATKYLGGHGDTVGGAVLGRTADLEPLRKHILRNFGAAMSPFNAWLILRGLATLSLRMQASCESARRIAEFLAVHPGVSRVCYPGLSDFPNQRIARRQMSAFGAMLAFDLRGGRPAAEAFLNSLRHFAMAVSLGDVRSLAQHPATMTHGHLDPEQRVRAGISDGTVRLSIGIEDSEDLIEDLGNALSAVLTHAPRHPSVVA